MNIFFGLFGMLIGIGIVIWHRPIMFYFGRIVWVEKVLGYGRSDWGYIILGLLLFFLGLSILVGIVDIQEMFGFHRQADLPNLPAVIK